MGNRQPRARVIKPPGRHPFPFDALEVLAASGYALYRSALHLCSSSPDYGKQMLAWMTADPQPGDLLLELSTIHRAKQPYRIGVFERYESAYPCEHEDDGPIIHCGCGPDKRMTTPTRYVWITTGIQGRERRLAPPLAQLRVHSRPADSGGDEGDPRLL